MPPCHGSRSERRPCLTAHTESATPHTQVTPHPSSMQLIVREQPAMKCPDKVQLSREDGEALRIRLARDALTADDRRVLDHVLQWYFWLLVALQEATFSLKRLRALVFGETRRNLRPRLLGRHRTPAVGL